MLYNWFMKYYCLGIKGAGMSALALALSDLGHTVSGYDQYTAFKKILRLNLKKKDLRSIMMILNLPKIPLLLIVKP